MSEITIKFNMPEIAESVIIGKISDFLGLINVWCEDIQYTAVKAPQEVSAHD